VEAGAISDFASSMIDGRRTIQEIFVDPAHVPAAPIDVRPALRTLIGMRK